MKIWISGLIIVFSTALMGCADVLEKDAQIAEVTSSMVKNPDEVTCRNVVRTGTRIGTKKCMTNRAWMQASRDAREATDSIQRKSTQINNPSSN